jgi:methylmalonyl-CoA/ethylmalonyl-CoA epimerase
LLKRIDHVGVVVDDLHEASAFLLSMGMHHDRDLEIQDRLKASFYTCGEIEVEIIEIVEPAERSKRLGSEKARIEHIAIEVDSLTTTLTSLANLGVKTQSLKPLRVDKGLSYWTVADSCDGVVYQLFERA